MVRVIRWFALAVTLLAAAAIYGCGGSGPASPAVGTGNLAVKVQFGNLRASQGSRSATRQQSGVPLGAAVVKVTLTDPSTMANLAQPQIVPAPAAGQTATVQFDGIRIGPVHIAVAAYPDQSASLPPLALGQADATVSSVATAPVMITVLPTADHITVAAGSGSLSSGSSLMLTATVFDSSNTSLTGYPLVWTSGNTNIVTVAVDPANPYSATLTGVTPGTATVEVREPNSGLTDLLTINVTSAGYKVSTLAVGSIPIGIAVNSTTNRIYVANFSSNTVTSIDGSNDTIITTIPVGANPVGVAVDLASNLIYVANSGGNNVSVIDGSTNVVTATIPVGKTPFGVAVNNSSGGSNVFVANDGDNSVSVISAATGQVVATTPVGMAPHGVAADPNTGLTFLTNRNSNSVTVINNTSLNVAATIPVGFSPLFLGVDSTGGHVYVPNTNSGTVSVIDESTDAVTQVQVGGEPFGIASGATANIGFVSDVSSNAISEYNLQSGQLLNTTTLSNGAYELALNTTTGKIYVTNDNTPGMVSILTPG